MRFFRIVALVAVLVFIPGGARVLAQATLGQGKPGPAASPSASEAPGAVSSQPGAPAPAPPAISGQGGSDTTLEIAPQYGAVRPREGKVDVIPGERNFKPGSDTASVEKKFEPGGEGGGGKGGGNRESRTGVRPYLGITVRYTKQCYLGREEHGLEVLTIDPRSPAEKAGLHGRESMTAAGAAGVTAGAMLAPLNLLTTPLLAKAGALGHGGDLIVAVDDRRVRSEQDFHEALAKMKPGDTVYLTVIRPVKGGHKTLKIAVKLGKVRYAESADGSSPPPQASAPATTPRW